MALPDPGTDLGSPALQEDSLPTELSGEPPAGKESTCNAGDLGSIPGWEDPLEKGTATHSSILAWTISVDCLVHGVSKSQTRLNDFHFTSSFTFGGQKSLMAVTFPF